MIGEDADRMGLFSERSTTMSINEIIPVVRAREAVMSQVEQFLLPLQEPSAAE
jgi:hypothetical protein